MSSAIDTGWPAVIDSSQCDATWHITMLILPVVCCERKRERRKRDNEESVKLRMNAWVSVRWRRVGVHACLSHWGAWNTKAAAGLLSSALTTLLVIMMTFKNMLKEDKRLNTEWVDVSMAKLQL